MTDLTQLTKKQLLDKIEIESVRAIGLPEQERAITWANFRRELDRRLNPQPAGDAAKALDDMCGECRSNLTDDGTKLLKAQQKLKQAIAAFEADSRMLEWLGKRGFDWSDNPPEGWIYSCYHDIREAIQAAMEAGDEGD